MMEESAPDPDPDPYKIMTDPEGLESYGSGSTTLLTIISLSKKSTGRPAR